MFITLDDSTINIEEIRNAYINAGAYYTLWIYFKNPSSPKDYLTLTYDTNKELKEAYRKLTEACEAYNKNKIKN